VGEGASREGFTFSREGFYTGGVWFSNFLFDKCRSPCPRHALSGLFANRSQRAHAYLTQTGKRHSIDGRSQESRGGWSTRGLYSWASPGGGIYGILYAIPRWGSCVCTPAAACGELQEVWRSAVMCGECWRCWCLGCSVTGERSRPMMVLAVVGKGARPMAPLVSYTRHGVLEGLTFCHCCC